MIYDGESPHSLQVRACVSREWPLDPGLGPQGVTQGQRRFGYLHFVETSSSK